MQKLDFSALATATEAPSDSLKKNPTPCPPNPKIFLQENPYTKKYKCSMSALHTSAKSL